MNTQKLLATLGVLVSMLGVFFVVDYMLTLPEPSVILDPTPQQAVLSGTYVCLPHRDTDGPQTEECAFGLRTDTGEYYAVNFGQSADALQQFMAGAHITAEGFVVIKEALSSAYWESYTMRGIFTITQIMDISDDVESVAESVTQKD